MAAFTTKAVAGTQYVLMKKDRIVFTVTGALSVSGEDVDFYDASTHSQIVDAAMLGNAHTQIGRAVGAKTIGTGAFSASDANLVFGGSNLQQITPLGEAVTESAITDASFVLTTTPGKTIKSDTLIIFWSGASAAGNAVAAFWKSEIRGWGPAAPTILT